jgi:hypothetical protein
VPNKYAARFLLLTFLLLLISVATCPAQQEVVPPLRFVSEWEIPRPQWPEFEVYQSKSLRPALEKLMSNEVIISWGIYSSMVNADNMQTHGMWFEVNSIAGCDKAVLELLKVPLSPVVASGVKHRERLYRTQFRQAKAASGSGALLYVNTTQIQQGKRQEWREWWDKYQKPNFEQYMADGLITMYEIVVDEIHTQGPNWSYLIYVAAYTKALDRLNTSFAARVAKRSAEENRAINDALDTTVIPSGHKDYIGRISAYAQK